MKHWGLIKSDSEEKGQEWEHVSLTVHSLFRTDENIKFWFTLGWGISEPETGMEWAWKTAWSQGRGTSFLTIRPCLIVVWLFLGELRNPSEKICWSKPGNPEPKELGYRRYLDPLWGVGWDEHQGHVLFWISKISKVKWAKRRRKLESCPKGDACPQRTGLPCANDAQPLPGGNNFWGIFQPRS